MISSTNLDFRENVAIAKSQMFGIFMVNDHNHKGNPLLFGTFAKSTGQDCGESGMTTKNIL